jgi:hypothetical protein
MRLCSALRTARYANAKTALIIPIVLILGWVVDAVIGFPSIQIGAAKEYIQHNPNVASGLDPVMRFFSGRPRCGHGSTSRRAAAHATSARRPAGPRTECP